MIHDKNGLVDDHGLWWELLACHLDSQGTELPFSSDSLAAEEMKRIFRAFRIQDFIECGTYKGVTTRAVAQWLPDLQVTGIEVAIHHYLYSCYTTAEYSNVRMRFGNSVNVLPRILDRERRQLVYLDSHWDTPVIHDELAVLAEQVPDRPIIVIDDFDIKSLCPDIQDRRQSLPYLTWGPKIRDLVERVYPHGYVWFVNRKSIGKPGKLFLFPLSQWSQSCYCESL